MREAVTTLLDTLGVLSVAAGAGVAVGGDVRIGAGILTAGIVLIAAVQASDWLAGRPRGELR